MILRQYHLVESGLKLKVFTRIPSKFYYFEWREICPCHNRIQTACKFGYNTSGLISSSLGRVLRLKSYTIVCLVVEIILHNLLHLMVKGTDHNDKVENFLWVLLV